MSLIVKVDKRHPYRPHQKFRFEGQGTRILKIGRLRASHIPVDDGCVSRLQAVLKVSNEGASLQNIGTKCHVLLNGNPIPPDAPVPLGNDDVVVMGATELRFRLAHSRGDPTPTRVEIPWIAALRGAGEATRMEIESVIRRRRAAAQPSPPIAPTELPVPVPALPDGEDAFVEASAKGAGEEPAKAEKYDTRNLVAKIRRERRKQQGLAMVFAATTVAVFWLCM